jgi:hypothetical protein
VQLLQPIEVYHCQINQLVKAVGYTSWPRVTDGDEDEQDERGEQDEMTDTSDVLDKEYRSPSTVNANSWGPARNSIDGLHYPPL